MSDALQSFRAAVLAILGHAPECIEPGRFQRFATSDRRGDSAVKAGSFVDPVRLGARCTRFRAGDVTAWIAAQVAAAK